MSEFPIHLDIESTNACQLKCGICPRINMKRKVGFMEFDVLKKIVDEARGKVQTSYLHQIGEPLLHKDIVKFINYVAGAGIETSVSTNCLALDEKKGKELLNSNLHELTLCVDSLHKDVYDRMRKGSDFQRVNWNVSKFLEMARGNYDLKITIQLIKTIYNIEEVETWQDYFNKKGKDCNYELLIKDFSTFANNVEDIGFETKELKKKCMKPYTTMTINWNGDVVLCCRDYDSFTVLGNIKERSLQSIWDNELAEMRDKFKKRDMPDFCKNC